LTLYWLIAIGWHGGEKLASLSLAEFSQALGFTFTYSVTICIHAYMLAALVVMKTIPVA
tara:strand:+ start:777 stop:953 length:177 start_codon:yes stop_codon:yes gene_type:complete